MRIFAMEADVCVAEGDVRTLTFYAPEQWQIDKFFKKAVTDERILASQASERGDRIEAELQKRPLRRAAVAEIVKDCVDGIDLDAESEEVRDIVMNVFAASYDYWPAAIKQAWAQAVIDGKMGFSSLVN